MLIPSNDSRRELFIKWYAWSLNYKDCDPAVWCTQYLNTRFEHNSEQRIWFCWLYGNTYHLPTAWILLNEFPDFELVTQDRISLWNTNNYNRLRYQTDTKWNKGHLPEMFESYKRFFGKDLQQDKFKLFLSGDSKKNFSVLWNTIKENFHKFGRYGTWFYLQHLRHTVDFPIEPECLMLNDFRGSKSHRNGLLMALGLDDFYDKELTQAEYLHLEHKASEILEESKERFPFLKSEMDFFTMETCLCSFKKIFRKREGRYLGYYLDRQADEIKKCSEDGWFGIDWNVLWQAREESLDSRLISKFGVDKEKFPLFLETNCLDRLNWMFPDEPEHLDLFSMLSSP